MRVKIKKKIVLSEEGTHDLVNMIPALSDGGLAELSDWGGCGALHTRSYLRTDEKGIIPETVEGTWFVVGVIRAMANGKLKYGFDDENLARAAQDLMVQIDKILDLYDS